MDLATRTPWPLRAGLVAALALGLAWLPQASNASVAPPAIDSPAADSVQPGVAPARVRIAGTAAPGSSVEVFDTLPLPQSLGTATAAGSGAWMLQVAMSDGAHTINAVADDGTTASAPSASVSFLVDGKRPSAAIGAPVPDHIFAAGEQPVLEGTATDDRELHAIKVEYWRLGQLKLVQLAECPGCDGNASAAWTHEPLLEPGTYTLKVWSFDAAGNSSLSTQRDFTTIGGAGMLPDTGDVGVELPEIVPPGIVSPGDGETKGGAAQPVTFTGTTEPGSRVELYEEVAGIGVIGTAIDDDENGVWRMNVRLGEGTYGVRARATDDEGNVSDLSELIVFDVDGLRPVLGDLPEGTQTFLPTEDVALGGSVSDNRGTGFVVLEYWLLDELVLRDVASCPDCGATDATWSHATHLDPGYYHVRVLSFDQAGNASYEAAITFVNATL